MPLIRFAIIDDDPTDTASIEQLLLRVAGTEEVRIDHFSSAELFLDTAASNCYHAAIMDIHLNGIDGIEACERLASLNDKTLVVFVTWKMSGALYRPIAVLTISARMSCRIPILWNAYISSLTRYTE